MVGVLITRIDCEDDFYFRRLQKLRDTTELQLELAWVETEQIEITSVDVE